MEVLRHKIQAAIEKGEWKAVRPARGTKTISHLFFTDDLVLFAKAIVKQAKVMKNIIKEFCNISGQKVNATITKFCLRECEA